MKLSRAVALRISELLREKNITQYRLEKLTALHHNTILSIMGEKNNSINLRTITLIIRALNVSLVDFFDSPLFNEDNLDVD